MKSAYLMMLLLMTLAAGLAVLAACEDEDSTEDDEDDCKALVDDPITDCESVCTQETCNAMLKCEDYVDAGSTDDCIADCFKGCELGCIPVGTEECVDKFDDCDSLVNCLKPLFNV